MIHLRCRAIFVAVALGTLACVSTALATPPAGPGQGEPGTWRLIPLPDTKVPAAWVINTTNGDTYLCGSGSHDGQARVACIQARFPGMQPR